jgi:hypothetical protein
VTIEIKNQPEGWTETKEHFGALFYGYSFLINNHMTKAIYTRKELGPIADYLMSFQKALTEEFLAGYESLEQAVKENGTPNLAGRPYDSASTIVSKNEKGMYEPSVESWMAVAFRYERHDGIVERSFTTPENHLHAIKYPTAYKLIKEFGDKCPIANYSCMAPNSILKRHTGPENRSGKYVRIHIPLIIPKGEIFLEVNAEEVNWDDMFGFNNQLMHSSFNLSDEFRLIFLIDLDREFIGLEPGTEYDPATASVAKPFIRNKNGYSILSATPPNGVYAKKL